MFRLLLDSYKYIILINAFENLKKSEKIEIIICGLHYFTKKLKAIIIDVMILSRFN